MKVTGCNFRSWPAAFTLPELMVAITIFSFVVLGVTFSHVYGLSMFRVTETSLRATTNAREASGRMIDEIRRCNTSLIGNVKNGSFVGLLNGEKQEGSGLLIYPSANQSEYILYFVNPADQTFRRATSETNSTVILAESITNAVVFCAENYLGVVQTNKLNNRVIHFNLEFYQPRRYRQMADYYKLEASVTRRSD
ncbi:MAG: prepilin-type N-terminal cleavage/methylation domain-containing protein [Verrucomicrobiota bacterium]